MACLPHPLRPHWYHRPSASLYTSSPSCSPFVLPSSATTKFTAARLGQVLNQCPGFPHLQHLFPVGLAHGLVFAIGQVVEPATTTMDWLTPLFSLTTGFDCDVNMGCLPLLVVELKDSKLRLENFKPAATPSAKNNQALQNS